MIFLYRINGKEVIAASTDLNGFNDANLAFYGIVTDPATPDGVDLSIPKIYLNSVLRNATQTEIDAFAVARATDQNLQERDAAWDRIQGNDRIQRKAFKAFCSVLLDEINTLRAQHSLAPRTLQQGLTAIRNKLDGGTVD